MGELFCEEVAWGHCFLDFGMGKEDAIKLGAHEYIVTRRRWIHEIEKAGKPFLLVANIKPDKCRWAEYTLFPSAPAETHDCHCGK